METPNHENVFPLRKLLSLLLSSSFINKTFFDETFGRTHSQRRETRECPLKVSHPSLISFQLIPHPPRRLHKSRKIFHPFDCIFKGLTQTQRRSFVLADTHEAEEFSENKKFSKLAGLGERFVIRSCRRSTNGLGIGQ